MVERDEFSVWVFLADGSHVPVVRYTDPKRAVAMARGATRSSGSSRIIITDGGDHTVFEWRRGEGVTWPPRWEPASS